MKFHQPEIAYCLGLYLYMVKSAGSPKTSEPKSLDYRVMLLISAVLLLAFVLTGYLFPEFSTEPETVGPPIINVIASVTCILLLFLMIVRYVTGKSKLFSLGDPRWYRGMLVFGFVVLLGRSIYTVITAVT